MGLTNLAMTQEATLSALPIERDETVFTPTPDNSRQYRDALGQFATGVTVITTDTPDGPVGMTVNSFASVSLDPALVLWSLSKSSGRFEVFQQAQNYAIHVLRNNQGDMAMNFAKNANAFLDCEWAPGSHNVPIINSTLARFECEVSAQHDAGDHIIIVGKVLQAAIAEGEPLLFCGGDFGTFNAT